MCYTKNVNIKKFTLLPLVASAESKDSWRQVSLNPGGLVHRTFYFYLTILVNVKSGNYSPRGRVGQKNVTYMVIMKAITTVTPGKNPPEETSKVSVSK